MKSRFRLGDFEWSAEGSETLVLQQWTSLMSVIRELLRFADQPAAPSAPSPALAALVEAAEAVSAGFKEYERKKWTTLASGGTLPMLADYIALPVRNMDAALAAAKETT